MHRIDRLAVGRRALCAKVTTTVKTVVQNVIYIKKKNEKKPSADNILFFLQNRKPSNVINRQKYYVIFELIRCNTDRMLQNFLLYCNRTVETILYARRKRVQ